MTRPLDAAILTDAVAAGRTFLLHRQRPDGRFECSYNGLDAATPELEDHQVRQALTLWGLVLAHDARPAPDGRVAIRRALQFFARHGRTRTDGLEYVCYPEAHMGATGTVALLALGLADFLHTETRLAVLPQHELTAYREWLAGLCHFLAALRLPDGRFAGHYNLTDGAPGDGPVSYYDGQALLALVEAADFLDDDSALRVMAGDTARALYDSYGSAPPRHGRGPGPEGFIHWGCLAYFRLADCAWAGGPQPFADWSLALAQVSVPMYQHLRDECLPAYLLQDMILGRELARRRGDQQLCSSFDHVIAAGISDAISRQVGGPWPNAFLQAHPVTDPEAAGGVINAPDNPLLRTDITKEQMHAALLALRYLFP